MLTVDRLVDPFVKGLDEIPDGLLKRIETLAEEGISEIHFDVMKDALGALIGKLYFADGILGSFDEPFVESGLLLVDILTGEDLLDTDEFDIFFVYVVAENIDGYLEIYEVYLSIHFWNIAERRL